MGKEKDKKPLFGGIFQKFFKPSAKAEAKKKKEHHLTVQRSIPYLEMGRDGICRVEEHLYSKTVRFYDINYQLAQNEDKNTIFESWCDFLNYFDSSIRFQLSFINHKSDMSEYKSRRILWIRTPLLWLLALSAVVVLAFWLHLTRKIFL